jgi:hypothetical protein
VWGRQQRTATVPYAIALPKLTTEQAREQTEPSRPGRPADPRLIRCAAAHAGAWPEGNFATAAVLSKRHRS